MGSARRKSRYTPIARKLRRNQTDAEVLLWSQLRNGRLAGTKFRHQFPMPPYVADFCNEKGHLIIELDGSQNMDSVESDNERAAFFERRGYRVIRFWNNDVFENLDGVLETLLEYVTSPSP
jgi:very-short-patch-repair endonuclease